MKTNVRNLEAQFCTPEAIKKTADKLLDIITTERLLSATPDDLHVIQLAVVENQRVECQARRDRIIQIMEGN